MNSKAKKILVTGGNGFLATNIIRELTGRGYQVRAMIRKSADTRGLEDLPAELYKGEVTDEADVKRASSGCDVVVHTAADTSQNHSTYHAYLPVNYRGTLNVLNACSENKVNRLIFISTANTIGHGTKNDPGNEKRDITYPFNRSGYAVSKAMAEDVVMEFVNKGAVDAVIINPSFMIGPYDQKPGSGRIIIRALNKKIVFIPPGGKNFIHVRDVATGVCNAIDKGRNGEKYLLSNQNLSYRDFYTRLKQITGERYLMFTIPASILTFMGLTGNFLRLFGLKSELNYINSRILCSGNYFSANKAINELNLPQTSIDDAIKEALDWFWENGSLSN